MFHSARRGLSYNRQSSDTVNGMIMRLPTTVKHKLITDWASGLDFGVGIAKWSKFTPFRSLPALNSQAQSPIAHGWVGGPFDDSNVELFTIFNALFELDWPTRVKWNKFGGQRLFWIDDKPRKREKTKTVTHTNRSRKNNRQTNMNKIERNFSHSLGWSCIRFSPNATKNCMKRKWIRLSFAGAK